MTTAVILLSPACPFCGSNTGRIPVIEIPLTPAVFAARVVCLGCRACGPEMTEPDRIFAAAHALTGWNKRVATLSSDSVN